MADEVSRIVGVGEWLEEYGKECKEGKVAVGKRCGGSVTDEGGG